MLLRIDDHSSTPKYKQVVESIISEIEKGNLKFGDLLPSINKVSEEYIIARDTVEKAYKELRDKGIIASVKGKGYYVQSTDSPDKIKVLLLFNKLSAYKKTIYYSIINSFGGRAIVDLHIHHYDARIFQKQLEENLGKYSYYVVMPHFFEGLNDLNLSKLFQKIPTEQLYLLDKYPSYLSAEYGGVYQDFEDDIYQALDNHSDLFKKYTTVNLVFPSDMNYPEEIVKGFRKFAGSNNLKWKILEGLTDQEINASEAYVVLEESDLVEVVKKSRLKNFTIGKEIGLVSYNETPLKEILADGITVISTDFEAMGRTLAEMILSKKHERVKNPFRLISRGSL